MILINGQRHNIAFSNDKASRVDTGDWNSIATSLSNNPKLEWRWLYANGVNIKDYGFTAEFHDYENRGGTFSYYFDTRIRVQTSYRGDVRLFITCPDNFRITYLRVNYNHANSVYYGSATLRAGGKYYYLRKASQGSTPIKEAVLTKPAKVEDFYLSAAASNRGSAYYCNVEELRGIFL